MAAGTKWLAGIATATAGAAIAGYLGLITVETVRFTRPERVDFRLVRGPVPHVVEQFLLTDQATGTRLDYHGQIGADLWQLGHTWTHIVAQRWEHVVATTFTAVKTEAERRAKS